MPCCDVVNRGAALYEDKVYLRTLDAQLVALNQDTGKVVWKKKIDDLPGRLLEYRRADDRQRQGDRRQCPAASSASSARSRRAMPRPARMVWYRPTVEGHMGTRRTARIARITGTTNETWPGDMWKIGGAATWLGGTYDPETEPALLRHRQSGALEQPAAPGRQLYIVLDAGHRPGQRRDQVALPGHAARRLGLRRRQRVRPVRAREGRQDDQCRRQGRPQRLLLRPRPHQRQVHQRLAVRHQDHLGQGHRRRRPAARRPDVAAEAAGDPSRRPPTARRASPCSRRPASSAARTGCRWPTAPNTRPVLRARQRMGHGHLERADRLQEGRGLSRRRLHHQAALRRPYRRRCARSIRRPARSSGRSRTRAARGAAC